MPNQIIVIEDDTGASVVVDEIAISVIDVAVQGAPGINGTNRTYVSSNDTTPAFLDTKLVAGTGITLTENNDGGNESLTITSTGGGISDHTLLSNIGTNSHAAIDLHIADGTLHYTQAAISITESQISDFGSYALASALTTHTGDATLHYTEASIDHTAIANIGTNSHAAIDLHIADATLHFTEASIDHTAIANIGTNTHAQLDTHLALSTVHFTQAAISITESQISDFGSYALASHLHTGVYEPVFSKNTGFNLVLGTGSGQVSEGNHTHLLNALSDVTLATLLNDQVLTYNSTSGDWENKTPTSGVTDHTLLSNIGTNTHVQLDTHLADATLHFTEGSIDHTAIANIGTNSHAAIDLHIADATLHYTQAAISITESQISDFGSYALASHNHSLDSLSNVTVTSIAANELLKWSGTAWINNTLAEAGIEPSFSKNTGFNLVLGTGSGQVSEGNHSHTVNGLSDATIATPLNDQVLTYNSTSGDWENKTPTSGVTDHTLLSNIGTNTHVQLDTHLADATLHFTEGSIDHTAIANIGTNSHAAIDLHIADGTLHYTQAAISITESQISDFGSYALASHNHSLDSLSNVTVTSIADGELIRWNGTAWINNTLSEAGIAAASHVHATGDITSGTFADARIAQSNITQHVAAIDHDLLLNFASGEHFTQAAISITESQISDFGSYALASHNHSLDSLSNVTITSNTAGEIVLWSGTAWINNTLAEAGIEPSFTKNTGFNLVLGIGSGQVAEGNHLHTGVYEPADATILKDADLGVTVQDYNVNIETLKNNRAATAAPAVTDDGSAGYAVGSEWSDTTNDKAYTCLDSSTGAAVWTETTGGGGGSSPLTTKGDLYTYTTADARLAVGSNHQILVADSGEASGLIYKNQAITMGSVPANRWMDTLLGGQIQSRTAVANRSTYIPFLYYGSQDVDAMGIVVNNTVGSKIRLGIYSNVSGAPGTLLVQTGDITVGSTGFKSATITTQSLSPGWYFLVVISDGATSFAAHNQNYIGGTIMPFTTSTLVSTKVYRDTNDQTSWTVLPTTPPALSTVTQHVIKIVLQAV